MAYLDDRIRDHPKVRRLSPRAFQYWIFTLCYCSAHATGGRLDDAIAFIRVTKRVQNELISVGLWEQEDDGIWVHDWTDYNEKRDERVEQKRAQARERAKRHRQKVRDNSVTVTRDVTRDTSVTPSRARATDQDHDQGSSHDLDLEEEPFLPSNVARPEGKNGWTEGDPEIKEQIKTSLAAAANEPADAPFPDDFPGLDDDIPF